MINVEIDRIMDYEAGNLSNNEMIEFFGDLIKCGLAWQLQGHYGRTAIALIREEYLDRDGNVLKLVD